MRKRVLFVVLLLCACLLCSCGSKSTAPTDAMLKEDLSASLKEYAPIQKLDSFEIETSLTEETAYTATVKVKAEDNFCTANFVADLSYTRYDQGWQMDFCNWQLTDYTVTSYPTTEEMNQFLQTEPSSETEASPSRSQYFTQQVCETIVSQEDGSLLCTGTAVGDSNQYASEQHSFNSQWNYEPLQSAWKCLWYNWERTTVFEDLSGSWPSVHAPGETITISNFTQDGFDVRCSALKTNTVHVEKVYNPQWPTYTGTGASGTEFNGVKTENQEIIVRFSVREDKIIVSYILDRNIDEATIS